MQSYRTNNDWSSIFDTIAEKIDPTVSRPDIHTRPTMILVDCYVSFQNVPPERPEKVKFTDKGFYYNYIYCGLDKTFTFDYENCWLEDVTEEDNRVNNHAYKGCLRLMKKEHICDLTFFDQNSFNHVKNLLYHYTIALDFQTKFTVEEMLGHGASANVHKIIDNKTGKKYAGKMITKEYLKKTPKRVISVTTEIGTLRKLSHPGIVKLIEVHEIESYVILVMEYLEGEALNPDLFKSLYNRESEVKNLFAQILSA
jgi:hypothetical protein